VFSVFGQLSKLPIALQIREALPGNRDCSFLLHDRHKSFSETLDEEVESWGIHVLRSPVPMPAANAHCERLIGTIRRECLDYVIPLNAYHLRRVLREWVSNYNTGRPHRSLGPGIPDRTQVNAPTSRCRSVSRFIAKPILGGVHHEYRWADAA
jgi:putative transposase